MYNADMSNDPTMRSCGEEWFRVNRPTLADEDIRVSKLHVQQQWWIEIPERLLKTDQYTNLLCEIGEGLGKHFHHLRVPLSYIAENRDSLDFHRDSRNSYNDRFPLHLSAKPGNLFQDERGAGKIDFSPFVYTQK